MRTRSPAGGARCKTTRVCGGACRRAADGRSLTTKTLTPKAGPRTADDSGDGAFFRPTFTGIKRRGTYGRVEEVRPRSVNFTQGHRFGEERKMENYVMSVIYPAVRNNNWTSRLCVSRYDGYSRGQL